MTEMEQKIVDTIEAIPALYGKPEQREKAIKAARQVFRDIHQIFSVDSSLNLETRIAKLKIIVETIEGVLCSCPHGMKWFKVKAGRGKSDKSRKCTIKVYKGEPQPEYGPSETGESSFYAPASMIYRDPKGTAWLPAFKVKELLAKVKQRSMYRFQQYDRVPVSDPAWPGKEEYFVELKSLLPSQREIDKELKVRKAKAEKRHKEYEARRAAQMVEREEKKRLETQKAVEAKQMKVVRRAKMEQVHSVDVTRSYSTQVKEGRYKRWKRCEEEFTNVSLYYSGKRVYIVEESGEETISTRANVRIASIRGSVNQKA